MKSDANSPGFFSVMQSFNRAFWCSNVIELFERWAYYGVRAGIAIYIVTAVALGGLGFNHLQKASIFLWWAACQSLLPTFTGGLADRYGYKKTVFFAITLAILGYLNMAVQTSYTPFFIACMMVATGTALFKPGIQGILAHSTSTKNAAMGWSFFYMVVNIGGFTGPLIAGYLRLFSWQWVFVTSACIHSLNYLILFTFKEPASGSVKELVQERIEGSFFNKVVCSVKEFFSILVGSLKNLFEPRLMLFLLVFSGFWLMFMQLFDLLPNYITDWVDTGSISIYLGEMFGRADWVEFGKSGAQLPAEWLINLDAGAIIFLMLPIGWIFGRIHPVPAMIIGIVLASAGLLVAGYTMSGWICCLGIMIFAIGEMIASPRKSEYLSMIAPPGKKGLYMGYVNFPQGIGWMIGSKIAGPIYQYQGDKVTLARDYMINQLHMAKHDVAIIPKEKVMETLQNALHHATSKETTQFLFNIYHPEKIWFIFAIIGMVSMLGMLAYYVIVEKSKKVQDSENSSSMETEEAAY